MTLKKEMKLKKDGYKCCLCGQWTLGWGDHRQYGNNPYPLKEKGQCCDECNMGVISARMAEYFCRQPRQQND